LAVTWQVVSGSRLLNGGTTGRWYGPVATTTLSASKLKVSVSMRNRPDGAWCSSVTRTPQRSGGVIRLAYSSRNCTMPSRCMKPSGSAPSYS
jgi:hypothetical protein